MILLHTEDKMFSKLVPDKFVNHFTEITPEIIKNIGGKVVFVDLDGTLVSKDEPLPTNEVRKWYESFILAGIEFILVSNNCYNRVSKFANDLGVPFVYSAKKPFKFGYKRAFLMVNAKYNNNEIIMIGDQIYTDTLGARRIGAKSIYVYPIDVSSTYTKFRLNFSEKAYLKEFKK